MTQLKSINEFNQEGISILSPSHLRVLNDYILTRETTGTRIYASPTLVRFLRDAFSWRTTPQREDYWRSIVNNYEQNNFGPNQMDRWEREWFEEFKRTFRVQPMVRDDADGNTDEDI